MFVFRWSDADNDNRTSLENKGLGATPLSYTSWVSFLNLSLNLFVAEWREESRRDVVNAKDGDMTDGTKVAERIEGTCEKEERKKDSISAM